MDAFSGLSPNPKRPMNGELMLKPRGHIMQPKQPSEPFSMIFQSMKINL